MNCMSNRDNVYTCIYTYLKHLIDINLTLAYLGSFEEGDATASLL